MLILDLHYYVSRAFVMTDNSVKEEEKRKKSTIFMVYSLRCVERKKPHIRRGEHTTD
jgi:hypothetical protein